MVKSSAPLKLHPKTVIERFDKKKWLSSSKKLAEFVGLLL